MTKEKPDQVPPVTAGRSGPLEYALTGRSVLAVLVVIAR
jgi:hypothetical protein